MLIRILRFPLEAVLTVLILLDEAVRPIYRPVVRWVARRQWARAFERWVAARHRFAILALLAIPFAIAEPLKIVALVWVGRGAVKLGVLTLVLAYLISFVVVERTYSAGREKLLTIGWFAYVMGLVAAVRDRLVAWIKGTALWRVATRTKARVVELLRFRSRH